MNIIEPRFNVIDTMMICAIGILIAQSQFLMAAAVGIAGMVITSTVSAVFGKRAKDRQWQLISKQGNTVGAIKKHRELYGTSLKQALDIVYAYEGKPPRP